MRITEIEFGFTKNIGNYQNERVTYRAILEPWENPEESLEILRNKIAEELNLRFELKDLRNRCEGRKGDLEIIESQLEVKKTELEKAKIAWDNFAEFLTGHGVDPTTLTIENFHNTRTEHSPYLQPGSGADDSAELGFGESEEISDYEKERYENWADDEDDDSRYGD